MADRTVRVRLLAEVAGFKQAMADARKETERTAAQFDRDGKRIETNAGRMVRSAEVNRDAWTTAGTSLATFGTIGVVALTTSAKAAIDWESAWTGVLKTVDGTHDELAQLERDLRQMAQTLPATHQEIAATAEAAGQLGVQVGNVAAFTRVMIDLGETTNLSADEAATSIAQLMNVMQTSPDAVNRLGAAVVALGNNGASTERDIVQMAQRIGGAGEIVGLTEAQVLGLANALASAGIEVEAGGSAISNIMIDISKAASAGGDDLAAWARVAGMSADDFAAAWKSDPADALATTIEGLGRMNAAGEDVFATLEDLGQSDVRVTRALLSMATSGDMLRESLALGTQAWEDNTALVIEAEKRYDTTAAKLSMARNSINDAAISIGETVLPALAGAAEAAADVAQAFSDLPEPVQAAVGGLAGVASVAALAGGSFLLLFPRVLETVEGLQRIGVVGPNATTALGKASKAAGALAAGYAAAAAAAALLPQATADSATAAGTSTRALMDMANGAELADTALGDILANNQGFWDWFDGNGINSVADAFGRLAEPTLNDRVGDLFYSIVPGTEAARKDSEALFTSIDQGLTSLVQSGQLALASEALDKIAADAGISRREARSLLPQYAGALAEVSTQETLAAESTKALTEEQQALNEEQQAVLDQWRDMATTAQSTFIDVGGAYQSIIDKNIELAQATADATESTEDSWSDFYDGQTVSAGSFIKQLEDQADALASWQENIRTLAERATTELPEDMQENARAMIDELLGQGVAAAPVVDLLAGMSDAEFAEVVDLWGRKGAEATDAFNAEIENILMPVITPTADMSEAQRRYLDWKARLEADEVTIPFVSPFTPFTPGSYGVGTVRADGRAGGGPIRGPGTGTSDSIPIWASDGEYMQTAAAHAFWGTSTMDAIRRRDVGAVMAAAAARGARGYRDGGPVVHPFQQAMYAAPQVVTVPVESRHETLSPVAFSGDIHVNDYESLMREARAARRVAAMGGNRG